MESSNLHHHHQQQLQDHLDAATASLAAPSCYGGDGSNYGWPPNITLNAGNVNPDFQEDIPNARDSLSENNAAKFHPFNKFLIQGLGHGWSNTDVDDRGSCLRDEASSPELSETKEEGNIISSDTYPRRNHMDLNTNVTDNSYACFHGVGHGMSSRGKLMSQIYPSVNMSNQLNPSLSDINMRALDGLLNSTGKGEGGSLRQRYSHNDLTLTKLTDHLQQHSTNLRSSYGDSALSNGAPETKRVSSWVEPIAKASSSSTANKKSRLLEYSRAPCPHLKVRKEKLGDRIASLQQLVAPFGKTDTASVLMEAIGYIKFLQNQVQTLSVPYMKSRSDQTRRALQRDHSNAEDKEEAKGDLRSRGLCLLPLSCITYITGDW